jgi:hypothetical protein
MNENIGRQLFRKLMKTRRVLKNSCLFTYIIPLLIHIFIKNPFILTSLPGLHIRPVLRPACRSLSGLHPPKSIHPSMSNVLSLSLHLEIILTPRNHCSHRQLGPVFGLFGKFCKNVDSIDFWFASIDDDIDFELFSKK